MKKNNAVIVDLAAVIEQSVAAEPPGRLAVWRGLPAGSGPLRLLLSSRTGPDN